jgi:hypothetical protein
MNIDKEKFFQLAGLVLGLISLGIAVVTIPTDVLVRAMFLMVFVTSLIIVVSVDAPPPRG